MRLPWPNGSRATRLATIHSHFDHFHFQPPAAEFFPMAQSLSTSYSHISQRMRDLSAGARLTIMFLVVLAVASIWIMLSTGESDSEYLYGGREFSKIELSKIEQAFATANLNEAEFVGSWVRLPRANKSEYLTALQGVFARNELSFDFYDFLEDKDWWGSHELRTLRLKNAREIELSRTIAMMPGIEEAKVSIDESVQSGLQKKTERTALAAVKPIGSSQLAARTAESIRDMVAARYVGLKRESVTVIDLNSGEIFASSSPPGPAAIPDDSYAIRARYYERDWRSKIQDMLSTIQGVKIHVNVILETPPSPPGQIGPAHTRLIPIKGIASIAIPSSYYRRVFLGRQEQGPSPSARQPTSAELRSIEVEVAGKVKQTVVSLLPKLSAGNNPYPDVQVSSYIDIPLSQLAASPTPLLGLPAWLTQLWRPIALTSLGLLALTIVVLRNRHRARIPDQEEIDQVPAESSESPTTPIDVAQPSLRDELNQLVQDEPDLVVETISKWLNDAA